MPNETMTEQLQSAVVELSSNLIANLTVEQQAALESKYMLLPIEVRSALTAKYPSMSFVAQYALRQLTKEANSAMASKQRPVWYSKLVLNAGSLRSNEKAIKEYAERQLRDLAESIDSKESTTLLKKYKNANDLTSKDVHIVQLAGIFGVNPANLS